jgi:hypothetical protein
MSWQLLEPHWVWVQARLPQLKFTIAGGLLNLTDGVLDSLDSMPALARIFGYPVKLSSTSLTQFNQLKRAILECCQLLSQLPQLRQSCSPWAFEMYPNPVLFRHLSFAVPAIIDSRWRHIPMGLNHINPKENVSPGGKTQQKRVAIDWEIKAEMRTTT